MAELEENVLKNALADRPRVLEKFGKDIKLSVNVTGTTVVTQRYVQFCRRINETSPFAGKNICIEVTEQAAIAFNDETINAMRALHEMGILLAIDDFSMGHTSIHYMRDNLFDIIKLDGGLVNGLVSHKNSQDIISSIVQLAGNLNMTVIAEFVDSEVKRVLLHAIGCDCYQGFLYSPALFL